MKALIVIPARGGSKGLPGKNIKPLLGKPLIHYTIDAAREVFNDAEIIVSTDSQKIKEVVESTGLKVPFTRPDELATDTASSRQVLLHSLNWFSKRYYNPNVIILLQPTSPLRTSKHIQEAIALYQSKYDMVVSVKRSKANPYFNLYEEDEKRLLFKSKEGNFIRRQDCPKVWEFNGAIYIINVHSLKTKKIQEFNKIKKYVMDKTTSIDIDSIDDFQYCEFVLTNLKNKGNSY